DLTVRITKDDKIVTVEADKANDLVEKPRFAFQFESVELARDGLAVTTAPVLVACDAPATAQATRRNRLPKAAQIALRAVSEAVEEAGSIPPASNHKPRPGPYQSISGAPTPIAAASAPQPSRGQDNRRSSAQPSTSSAKDTWAYGTTKHGPSAKRLQSQQCHEGARVGEHSEHPLREMFAMFARAP